MQSSSWGLIVALFFATACSSKDHEVSEYAKDIDRICHAEKHSGALQQPEGYRSQTVAQWLGNNLVTQEARGLLLKLVQAKPSEKIKILNEEARKAQLKGCDLAKSWGG